MANYYYLGRSAFSDILIWFTLCVILSCVGLFTMAVGISDRSEALTELRLLEDERQALDHELNGSNLESALKSLEKYRAGLGKIGAEENLEKEFLSNARLERRHFRSVVRMVKMGKVDAEIEAWLKEQVMPGINRGITAEQAMLDLYDGILNGSENEADLRATLEKEARIPIEIKAIALHSKFSFFDGGRAMLNEMKGENGNQRIQLTDLMTQEDDAIGRSTTTFKERVEKMPTLREEYLNRSKQLDEKRASQLDDQTELWNSFLKDTKDVVEKRRQRELEIFEKQTQLEYIESLLVSKVKGQDYIPPLDLIDGTVLSSDMDRGVIVIDIGRQDALRLGQHFDVFQVKGETLQERKARVVVVDLDLHVAVCRVLESRVLDPIVPGDRVANGPDDKPFDRKISPVYVLSGRFYKSYSKELVEFLIQISGGKLEEQIYKHVDFVIIGDQPDDDDIKLCRQLGVRTVRVRDLPQHLNLTFAEVEQLRKQNWN